MESPKRDAGWQWTAGSVLRTTAIVIALSVAAIFAWKIRSILIVGFFGVLFGILLAAAAAKLTRFRIPQAVGAIGIVVAFLGLLTGLGFMTAPLIREQAREIRERLPRVIDRLEQRFGVDASAIGQEIAEGVGLEGTNGAAEGEPAGGVRSASATDRPGAAPPAEQRNGDAGEAGAAESMRRSPDQNPAGGQQRGEQDRGIQDMVTSNLGRIRDVLFPVASAAVDVIAGVLIVLFVAIFIAVKPKLYRGGLLRIVPARSRGEADHILDDLGSSLLQWLLARLMAMLAVGLIVGISLALMGIEGAIVLGAIAGLLEFIPFFGPVVAALPAIGMALLDSPEKAWWVVILFVIVQQIEGNVLTPLLLQNRVDVPPVMTVLAVPALVIVFGLIGGLVAEPLLAVSIVLTRKLWVERHADRMKD